MLLGHIYELSRTQTGCRRLQKLLDKESNSWKLVYGELSDEFPALITDPFAHHLCLRLLDFITPKIREELLQAIQQDLVVVSLSVHGTRVIQKLLEKMETATELRIVKVTFVFFWLLLHNTKTFTVEINLIPTKKKLHFTFNEE